MRSATVSTSDARLLLLRRAELLTAPRASCSPARTLKLINEIGFVQLDSIHIVERAHHHILWSRLPGYRPSHLDTLQRRGDIFEHWTHDASLIPSTLYPHWKHRFERVAWSNWFSGQLGAKQTEVLSHVRSRIEHEGPLMAKDFEHEAPRKSSGWWDWKPAKAGLEYLWRRGELAIPHRVNFHKVYDLTPRVLAHVCNTPAPSHDEHITWACESALDRLTIATPSQLARFWNAITIAQARAWCAKRVDEGSLVPVTLQTAQGKSLAAFADARYPQRVRRARAAFEQVRDNTRVLNPFDPILRDRARCAALFNFDYRFEAFTPAPTRKFGYYVLPILHGDQLIARVDPQLDRNSETLTIRSVFWEDAVSLAARRTLMRNLEVALHEYAIFCGATKLIIPARAAR
jgi:uncharacterized protein YcaQ